MLFASSRKDLLFCFMFDECVFSLAFRISAIAVIVTNYDFGRNYMFNVVVSGLLKVWERV